jgi:hypothetical protein
MTTCRNFSPPRALGCGFLVLLLASCSEPEKPVPPVDQTAIVSARLSVARLDAAKAQLAAKSPDKALLLLVSALQSDPETPEILSQIREILAETRFHLPLTTLRHELPVTHLAFAAPSTLWVSLSDGSIDTAVRWNLDSLEIEDVLFPVRHSETRSFILSDNAQSLVVQRGPVTLLCDAKTLKPITDLGPLPEDLTPQSVIVFSPDGLLIGHPKISADSNLLWQIRDAATGQTIRTTEPIPAGHPAPLAARFESQALQVLHTDGSLLEIPFSPIEEIHRLNPETPNHFLHAHFAKTGRITMTDQGPHRPATFDGPALDLAETPWSRKPSLWTGLLRSAENPPIQISQNHLTFSTSHSPVQTGSPITAAVFGKDKFFVATENGEVEIDQYLPLPAKTGRGTEKIRCSPSALTALKNLTESLTGLSFNEDKNTFEALTVTKRSQMLGTTDFTQLETIIPGLDFTRTRDFVSWNSTPDPEPRSYFRLWNRLSRFDPTGYFQPRSLRKSNVFTEPLAPASAVEAAFQTGNSEIILSAIKAAEGNEAVTALALSLDSDHPEWIAASVRSAQNLPPLLNRLADSRIAWLENRKADAFASWPESFPDLREIQQTEDWEGWEGVDFSPRFEALSQAFDAEIASYELPPNSTEEQREALEKRLLQSETRMILGQKRHAEVCLKAALAFAQFADETQATFLLANVARNLGAPAVPCLRAEALALTRLGDHEKALPRWIELITEHPVESHESGDYAEAAYTAFENANPPQAMEILATGIHRFPNDAGFALRAGWVALLTENPQRAYQFLRTGEAIGFPEEKRENAIALLAIASAQTGLIDEAQAYFQALAELDTAWLKPATIESLEWPEDLKATLRQLVW